MDNVLTDNTYNILNLSLLWFISTELYDTARNQITYSPECPQIYAITGNLSELVWSQYG